MIKKIIGILAMSALVFAAPIEVEAAVIGSNTNIDQVNTGYSLVPENIKSLMNTKGTNITTQDGSIYGPNCGGYNVVEGYEDGTITNQQIYINVQSTGIAHAVIHEVGHVVDSGNGNYNSRWSAQPTWSQIWGAEAAGADLDCAGLQVWSQSYEKGSPLEYFAGAFAAYVSDPTGLAATAPLTYGYIEAVVASY